MGLENSDGSESGMEGWTQARQAWPGDAGEETSRKRRRRRSVSCLSHKRGSCGGVCMRGGGWADSDVKEEVDWLAKTHVHSSLFLLLLCFACVSI